MGGDWSVWYVVVSEVCGSREWSWLFFCVCDGVCGVEGGLACQVCVLFCYGVVDV